MLLAENPLWIKSLYKRFQGGREEAEIASVLQQQITTYQKLIKLFGLLLNFYQFGGVADNAWVLFRWRQEMFTVLSMKQSAAKLLKFELKTIQNEYYSKAFEFEVNEANPYR